MYVFQEVFLDWFDALPPVQQEALARIFWFLVTQDLSDLALPSPMLIHKFRGHVAAAEPPVRALARICLVGSLVDLILDNLETLFHIRDPAFQAQDKVANLDRKQFQKTRRTWSALRQTRLSKENFSVWLSHMATPS